MALSRREFLAGAAAAAGAGVLLSSPAGAVAEVLPRITRVREPALAPATLTMWTNHPEWVQQVTSLVGEFEKQYPTVKVQVTPKPGPNYPTLLTSALAADSAPNIFGMSAGGTYNGIAQAGRLHDLTGKINIGALLPSATAFMYVNNKVYGLPLLGEYTTGIYYWKPVFAKYKLGIPQTWSEFTELCKTIQSKNTAAALGMPSQDGIIPTFFWTGFMTAVHGPAGVSDIAEGKAKLTDPEFLAAATYMLSLVPYFAPGWASTAYINGKADFAEGKNVLFEGGSADYTGFKNINPAVDLGFFAFPHPDGMGVTTVNSGIDFLYGLNSNVKDPAQVAAAIAFFNFFLTPKVGTQVAETIELPDTKGAHTNVPIQEEIIQQSTNDAAEWFQFPQLSNMWTYSTNNISKMLLGSVTPKQFAAACQAQIK
ncbi:MAG TPA: extracellular solute-binding protein [Acidimicrobiales bacterium]|nr:extracellular solute-binding protein [Acidimicrobiales bacterium]